MQQSVAAGWLLALVICILTVLLQPADTKKWVQFLEQENISYNKAELDFEPEIISAETVDVRTKVKKIDSINGRRYWNIQKWFWEKDRQKLS